MEELAFQGCTALSRVEFEAPSKLKNLYLASFCDCSSLRTICVPKSVRQIASSSKRGRTSLQSISFQSGSRLREIGRYAFSNCPILESITLPESVRIVNVQAWSGRETVFTILIQPTRNFLFQGSETAQALCFSWGSCLQSTLPFKYSEYGRRDPLWYWFHPPSSSVPCSSPQPVVFCDASTLQSICIPNSVERISSPCFTNCYQLSSVLFEAPSKLREISSGAFENCPSLRSIWFPSSLQIIPLQSFSDCRIIFLDFERPSKLQSLSLWIPSDFQGEQIQIPDSVIDLHLEFRAGQSKPLVVNLGIDSHLTSFIGHTVACPSGGRGCFARFSEPVLKRFREW
jgi:hypothetical protein